MTNPERNHKNPRTKKYPSSVEVLGRTRTGWAVGAIVNGGLVGGTGLVVRKMGDEEEDGGDEDRDGEGDGDLQFGWAVPCSFNHAAHSLSSHAYAVPPMERKTARTRSSLIGRARRRLRR